MIPSGPAGEYDAFVVEAAHQDRDALTDATEQLGLRHGAVAEDQFARVRSAHAELVELLRRRKSGKPFFDDERGNPLRPERRVHGRVHDEHVGAGPVGDPHLAAVEHEIVAAIDRAQFHADHVGAGVRFAHRERAEVFAGHERRQVTLLLLRGAETPQLVHTQVRVRTVRQTHRCGRAADLFHRDAVGEVTHRRAAVFRLDGDPQQPELAELRPQRARKRVGAIHVGRERCDFARANATRRVAQHVDRLAEAEVEVGKRLGHDRR